MNESLTEFIKISGKFDNNVDFLKQSLKIFNQNKQEFHNNYTSFLKILDFTIQDYKKKVAVNQVYLEFKKIFNDSLTEVFKISGKFDHNADYLKQSLKIF